MITTFVLLLGVTARAGAMPFATSPPAGVVDRVLYYAGLGTFADENLRRDVRAVMDRVASEVAPDFDLSPFDAERAVELAIEPTTLVMRAFDRSLNANGRPDRFEEDLRLAVLARLRHHQPGLVVAGAAGPAELRGEILRRLGLHEWREGGDGLRLAFDDERWHWFTLLSGEVSLEDFAADHLARLAALVRARRPVARLANSAARADVLAAMDEVAGELRAQTLALPARVEATVETLSARRATAAPRRPRRQQSQAPREPLWTRLVPHHPAPEPAGENWTERLNRVANERGFDRGLLGTGAPDAPPGPCEGPFLR